METSCRPADSAVVAPGPSVQVSLVEAVDRSQAGVMTWRDPALEADDTAPGAAMQASAASDLHARLGADGLRAATATWIVVNAVNVLQSIGFATRPFAPGVNPVLGLVIAALAIPATWALIVFVRVGAGWRFVAGPLVFDGFVVLMLLVDHLLGIPWRDPVIPAIQVPYLVLFFGSILLLGAPMLRIDRRRWSVTAATTTLLLASMVYAMAMGVG
jgi:hypothetical protein